MQTDSRIPCVDALKAIACLLIVLHHLAFYGPMSDIAYPLMPGLVDWLYQNARIAVQVFLVTAGFLLAGKLAPDGFGPIPIPNPIQIIKQRYLRLSIPYFFALAAAIVCAAIVKPTLLHNEVPDFPDLPQLLANVLLLQDLLFKDALSAGIWYVAIDLQLFVSATLILWICGVAAQRYARLSVLAPLSIVALVTASLFFFNRDPHWDNTALYFFGSYGLGMLAYWVSRRRYGMLWLVLLALLTIAAELLEYRLRIAVAGSVMLLLGLARQYPGLGARPIPGFISYLGRISYSVFLIHYPICLLVNDFFFLIFPHSAPMNAVGMLTALGASVASGALFFRYIEDGAAFRAIGALFARAGTTI
ncbi:MAG: hypothetical protein JWP38_1124 [Herbaspirillum sp.]|nr:hypothetical protein [Herbaspirillum sp.]